MSEDYDMNLTKSICTLTEVVATLLHERDVAFRKAETVLYQKEDLQATLTKENRDQLIELQKKTDIINKQQARINEIQGDFQRLRDAHKPTGTTIA